MTSRTDIAQDMTARLRFGTVCSGIEAPSIAWEPSWQPVFFAEIEAFPSSVLAHRWPHVPNLGDVTRITQEQIEAFGPLDVFLFGAPCQDASVAGQRKGLYHADGTLTRSGLVFDCIKIANWTRARWTIYENVPGLFSLAEGRAFADVVGAMAGCEISLPEGEGWRTAGCALGPAGLVEWFTLDAQYVRVESHPRAVPQRRRRVFIVRDSGDWQNRAPLFLNEQSVCWHTPPRRETGQRVAGSLAARTGGGGGLGTDCELDGGVIAHALTTHMVKGGDPTTDNYVAVFQERWNDDPVAQSIRDASAGGGSHANLVAHSLKAEGFDASEDGTGRGVPLVAQTVTADMYRSGGAVAGNNDQGVRNCIVACFDEHQVTSKDNRGQCKGDVAGTHTTAQAVAFNVQSTNSCAMQGSGRARAANEAEVARCLDGAGFTPQQGGTVISEVGPAYAVRRLSPLECERLMGAPDGHTAIPIGKKQTPAKDGPRYKALGNSIAVNCLRYIADRINQLI